MSVSHQIVYRKDFFSLELRFRLCVGDRFHPALLAGAGLGSPETWKYIDKWCIVAFVVREVWVLPDGDDLEVRVSSIRDRAKYLST